VKRIAEIRDEGGCGPVAVFSAPMGCTDALIRIGESYTQACQLPLEPVFKVYEHLAKLYVKGKYLKQAQNELVNYRELTQTTLDAINKRFSGNIKARTLTLGGELAISTLMDYILKSNNLDSCCLSMENWPIVTDDNFEDALPNYDLSKRNLHRRWQSCFFGGLLRRNSRRT
jgi:aspartate kinase